ncbi:MAG TPA: hypothetical protein VFW89_08800 [Gemmatimonadaceae bacterium]|nr:hypothetical protein [Gemmatimonadaceae bacterium]
MSRVAHAIGVVGTGVNFGTFSLFPPDNPGTFIIATQSKLRGGGAIVLSLQRPEVVAPSDTVRIILRPIEFVNR